MWDPGSFACDLLRAMAARDSAASALEARARGKKATIGVVDGDDWVPVLRLSNPSAACNVMNLDVRHGTRWAPTFERGTSDALAEKLLGELRFTWAMQAGWAETSEHGH
jgi:hypothetical protein